MSTDYETESGLVFLSSDGIIPSNIVSLCEEAMRRKMYSFIQHEVDLTTFAKPALFNGDLQVCKEVMNGVAKGMDLTEHLMDFCMCAGDLEMVSINVSNTNSSELGECSNFNSHIQILDQVQHQNGSYRLYLPFTDDMCTQLNSRLIEETHCYFATLHRKIIEKRRRDCKLQQRTFGEMADWNRAANWKAEHACSREKFLTRAGLQPPQLLRVIDIEATCKQGERVVLINYWAVQQVGYTAISHTYGMYVYEAFDCPCASQCSANVRPRCANKVCPHQDDASSPDVGAAGSEKHKRTVNDILRMCDILRKSGVNYAWHDGVCIAQHDDAEVEETIKHMGWIYANAKETVIFLHYVGNPMAPIRNSNVMDELCCRWHTRVWTLQEAALSKCRRYCVRAGPLGDCQSLKKFEEKIDLWYRDDSNTIEIMEEERFFEFVKEIDTVLSPLIVNHEEKALSILDDDDVIVESNWMFAKATRWSVCVAELLQTLLWTCFEFPRMERTLQLCTGRDSKHRGDIMNSILALVEVKEFVAQKDANVEASTIEFFKRQGHLGLARALFSINRELGIKDKEYIKEEREHTWTPFLWSGLTLHETKGELEGGIGFEVVDDGRLELRGAAMICLKVRFTVKIGDTDELINGEQDTDELVLPNDLACLHMDLTRFNLSEFKASISGRIIGDMSISAIETCNSTQGPLLSCEISDGDSFDAYLVIAQMSWPLIVQGRLDAPVSKVGVLDPEGIKFLLDRVPMICPAQAIIHKLIIT